MPSFPDGAATSKLSSSLAFKVSEHIQRTAFGNEAATRIRKLNWSWIHKSHVVQSIVNHK